MAQTVTQKNPHALGQLSTGRILDTGTVAAFPVTLGFKPRVVRVYNLTDSTMIEWFEGMADASAVKTLLNGTRALITSNGITMAADGFVIGLDTDVNVTNKQLAWVAQR